MGPLPSQALTPPAPSALKLLEICLPGGDALDRGELGSLHEAVCADSKLMKILYESPDFLTFCKCTELEVSLIWIQLWDTAGQERFRKSMVQHYYRNVHAVVFVYDMTNIASFHSLPSWIEECKQHLLSSDIPRILVGNKCDLRSAIQVPTDLAQKFADTHSMPLFETSAKNPNDNDHVEAIFMTLAHKLKSHKPLMLSQPPDRDEIHLKPEPKPAMTCWC
nr:PREDICTED: ras-related protein Rab-33B [Opisthocomus hoazin]